MHLHRLQNRLFALVFSRFPALTARWVKRQKLASAGPPPWVPFHKSLAQCRIALVTTAGVHLHTDAPFDMSDKDGDPSFRIIPQAASQPALRITHDYYDHRDADKDVNIVLPLDRLREFSHAGEIGAVAPSHYSFMGHIDGRHIERLLAETAPDVARRLRHEQVDAVVLTPA